MSAFAFGPFVLDVAERRVMHGGKPLTVAEHDRVIALFILGGVEQSKALALFGHPIEFLKLHGSFGARQFL